MKKTLVTKKLWLVLAVIAVLVFAGIAILSQKIPELVEKRIRSELLAYGVDNFSLGEPYWGLSGAGTTQVLLSGQYDNWLYAVTIEELQANYHWRTLIDGEIHSLSVDTLSLTVTQLGDSEETSSEPVDIDGLFNALDSLNLPVETIAISTLNVDFPLVAADGVVHGKNLRFNNADRSFLGHFTLTASGDGLARRPSLHLTATGKAFDTEAVAAIGWLPSLVIAAEDNGEIFFQGVLGFQKHLLVDRVEYSLPFRAEVNHHNIMPLLSLIDSSTDNNSDERHGIMAPKITLQGTANLPQVVELSDSGWWQKIDLAADMDGSIRVQNLFGLEDVGVESVEASVAFRLSSFDGRLALTMAEPARFLSQLNAAALDGIEHQLGWTGDVPLTASMQLTEPLTIAFPKAEHWQLNTTAVAININAGDADQALTAEFNANNIRVSKKIEADVDGVVVMPYQGKRLPPLQLKTQLSQEDGSLALRGDFVIDDWRLDGDVKLAYTTGSFAAGGGARFQSLAIVVAELGRFGFYEGEIALASGKADVDFSVTGLTPKDGAMVLAYNIDFDATNISGLAEGVAFADVELRGGIARQNHWSSKKPIRIRAGQVSSGVQVTDLETQVRLKPSEDFANSHWQIDSFSASLFSGTVALAKPAAIDFPFSGNALTIRVSKLRLDDILALYESQGVRGSGVISGEIPLIFEKEGLRIDNGRLESIESGKIIFANAKAAALGSGNEQLAMTMRLLENFSYDVLRVTTDFEPSGKMFLGVQLSGRNPAEFDGRQINFNINLEENIYDLFKVLRLTDDMTKKLEKHLQK